MPAMRRGSGFMGALGRLKKRALWASPSRPLWSGLESGRQQHFSPTDGYECVSDVGNARLSCRAYHRTKSTRCVNFSMPSQYEKRFVSQNWIDGAATHSGTRVLVVAMGGPISRFRQ